MRGAEDGVDQAGTALVELGAGWRWAFPMPAPVALVTLVAGARLLPVTRAPRLHWARIDVVGAVLLTSAMLLLVYALVEAPAVGWRSARASGSLLAFGVLLAAFVGYEQRVSSPLVRLGVLRSSTLARDGPGDPPGQLPRHK